MAACHSLCDSCRHRFALAGDQGGYRGDNGLLPISERVDELQLSKSERHDALSHPLCHSSHHHSDLLHEHGEPFDCEYEERAW